ncbi:dephospho-CoA kinase [Terrilactibacillus sp. S3-3]|nr:dephospho-CoA kinase [Terrilactibacillus sp. S3-3]
MLKIGLTGGIASGKSTVSSWQDRGFPIIDADVIAREVVESNEPAYNEIVKVFGPSILSPDGSLNRPALGQIIFADQKKREDLNRMVHPAVRRRMLEALSACEADGKKAVFLDIPLLFEGGLEEWVDRTLLVYVTRAVQIKRLMDRNQLSEDEAVQRIESQMSLERKKKLADAVIDNNGDFSNTESQIRSLLKKWNLME